MISYKMLILTDHSGHSAANSVYALANATLQHPACAQLDIATRGRAENNAFFSDHATEELQATEVKADFAFTPEGTAYQPLKEVSLREYDVVWLRLPPPLSLPFLDFLQNTFPNQLFINDPGGIYETGSKAFLLNFPEYCAPMKHCQSIEDIIAFKEKFPIVLKPLREYGGKGIVRIDGTSVWEGNRQFTFQEFIDQQNGSAIDYLGVKFLKNVGKGDKRIVVVNGEILGASLRLPAKGSWLCNVAMGGRSEPAIIEQEEKDIIEGIHPELSRLGIVMYGVDTLVNDNGYRILSEINTSSIGGVTQLNQAKVDRAVHLIWDFIIKKNTKEDVTRN